MVLVNKIVGFHGRVKHNPKCLQLTKHRENEEGGAKAKPCHQSGIREELKMFVDSDGRRLVQVARVTEDISEMSEALNGVY